VNGGNIDPTLAADGWLAVVGETSINDDPSEAAIRVMLGYFVALWFVSVAALLLILN
jgi:hypothetical protein